jgi:nucleoside-diphosphate-sugar epimerase
VDEEIDMIVVTDATGNVGRALVRMLAETQVPVTAVARHITDADVPPGVRAVAADLAEPPGLRVAFDGAEAQFMPLPVVEGTLAILGEPTEGEQWVSPDAERVLGRAPGTFAAWAERNVAAFR